MAEKKYLDQNGLLYFWTKVKGFLDGKVDKVPGMGLSHNDLTDELLEKINDAGSSSFTGAYADLTGKPSINGHELASGDNTLANLGIQAAGDYATTTQLNNKVDKVSGKGLSTNDYTTPEKTKLAGIEAGAEVNTIEGISVNGESQTPDEGTKVVDIDVPTALSQLTNDGNFVTDSNYVHTDNNFTTALLNKLNGIANGAQANVIETIAVNGSNLTPTSKKVNITVPTATSQITNDSNFVEDADYVHTDNNYTTTEKSKLAGIAANAQVNVIETIAVNGANQQVSDKKVNITVPTAVSNLTNDSGFQTATQVNSAISSATADFMTEGEITQAISEATADLATEEYVTQQLANYNKKEVVESTEEMTDKNTIYLMESAQPGQNNIYDEYIVVDTGSGPVAEKIGTTEVDLTNYVKNTDLVAITNGEIDTIMAGK